MTGNADAFELMASSGRRQTALELAIDACRDDKAYRDARGVDVRTDRILHTARKFDAFLRGDTDIPAVKSGWPAGVLALIEQARLGATFPPEATDALVALEAAGLVGRNGNVWMATNRGLEALGRGEV